MFSVLLSQASLLSNKECAILGGSSLKEWKFDCCASSFKSKASCRSFTLLRCVLWQPWQAGQNSCSTKAVPAVPKIFGQNFSHGVTLSSCRLCSLPSVPHILSYHNYFFSVGHAHNLWAGARWRFEGCLQKSLYPLETARLQDEWETERYLQAALLPLKKEAFVRSIPLIHGIEALLILHLTTSSRATKQNHSWLLEDS